MRIRFAILATFSEILPVKTSMKKIYKITVAEKNGTNFSGIKAKGSKREVGFRNLKA